MNTRSEPAHPVQESAPDTSVPCSALHEPCSARKSKIAGLPRVIREELNTRLEDGAPGPALLQWLNGLPEVRQMLNERFNGNDITEQNLSDWRQGGFRDWQREQRFLDASKHLVKTAQAVFEDADGESSLANVTALASVALSRLLIHHAGEQDPNSAVVLSILRELTKLRRLELEERNARLKQAKWEAEQTRASETAQRSLSMHSGTIANPSELQPSALSPQPSQSAPLAPQPSQLPSIPGAMFPASLVRKLVRPKDFIRLQRALNAQSSPTSAQKILAA